MSDEDVLAAAVRLNKTVALGRVEPFDCTCRHVRTPCCRKDRNLVAAKSTASRNAKHKKPPLGWLSDGSSEIIRASPNAPTARSPPRRRIDCGKVFKSALLRVLSVSRPIKTHGYCPAKIAERSSLWGSSKARRPARAASADAA
jgi:hypothetical protein